MTMTKVNKTDSEIETGFDNGRDLTTPQKLMKDVMFIHDMAMEFCDKAMVADFEGGFKGKNQREIDEYRRQAFLLEKKAAMLLEDEDGCPVTRCVLFRSAAVLALDCEEYEEAQKLVDIGLSKKGPGMIESEIRELQEVIDKRQ